MFLFVAVFLLAAAAVGMPVKKMHDTKPVGDAGLAVDDLFQGSSSAAVFGSSFASWGGDAGSLANFSPGEFLGYWDVMNVDLLQRLDALASALKAEYPGTSVKVSDTGRRGGSKSSYHHYTGEAGDTVDAVDIQLNRVIDGKRQRYTKEEHRRAFDIAREYFGGVGAYAHWTYPGLHLDTRPSPLVWRADSVAGVQKYFYGQNEAYRAFV